MSIVVDHEKRRLEILEKVIDVFVDEGYGNVTFKKIADRCNITRTTLYIYFKNKKEIFNFSIRTLLSKVNDNIQKICLDDSLGSIDKIIKIFIDVFNVFEENRILLSVIFEFLLSQSKSTKDPQERIKRRTIKFRHILASLVIQGIKNGEIKAIEVSIIDGILYSFIEAAIYRLVILQSNTVGDLKKITAAMVRQLGV